MEQQDIGFHLVPVYYSDTGISTQNVPTIYAATLSCYGEFFYRSNQHDFFPEQRTLQVIMTDFATRDYWRALFISKAYYHG